jgi:3D (Asp-Asp-Asp) domain-containing protein
MRRTISRSLGRTLAVTLVLITGFVLLYEVNTIDSVWPWSAAPVDPTRPVPGARLQFSATAYCKGDRTASGVSVQTGIAAADRALLPVGSVVTVTTDEARYNGVYTVMDTGPEVQGRELDLYIWSCTEALAFGRKQVQVEVLRLGWNPNASTPSLIDRIFRRPARRAAPPAPPAAAPPQPPAINEAASPGVEELNAEPTPFVEPAPPGAGTPEPPPQKAAPATPAAPGAPR